MYEMPGNPAGQTETLKAKGELSRMKILDDLLATLNFDVAVKDIRQGAFHNGVNRVLGPEKWAPFPTVNQTRKVRTGK